MFWKKNSGFLRKVTFRLTVWYLALFATFSITVFSLIFAMLTSDLRQRADEELLDNMREYEACYKENGLIKTNRMFVDEAAGDGISRVFNLLLSPSSQILASSDLSAWQGIGLTADKYADLSDKASFKTLSVPGQEYKVRLIYKKIGDGNIMVLGASLEDDEEIYEGYRNIFIVGLLLMMTCGGFLGLVMARRAMAGVERVTQTAIQISRGTLGQRVPAGNEGEEIENLVSAFNDMLQRICVLVRELKDVSNNIAHDLRSPITRIRGIAETTLTNGKSLEEYQEMAGVVVEESDRLVEIINTMLEIAATDSGMETTARTTVNINEVVRDAYDIFLPVAEGKDIRFRLSLPQEPFFTSGNISRLQRAIANLVDNAIKFTPEGGEVQLTAGATVDRVLISVIDSGMGMDQKELDRIFERFYRVDKSRSTPGNGLGLSLVRAIVHAHGGEIQVKSQPGKGSGFTVALPRLSASH
ncbi:HAMP domain-containing protein [bacterium]|nr:HAMP domain-containing protein [bacterium]